MTSSPLAILFVHFMQAPPVQKRELAALRPLPQPKSCDELLELDLSETDAIKCIIAMISARPNSHMLMLGIKNFINLKLKNNELGNEFAALFSKFERREINLASLKERLRLLRPENFKEFAT